MRGVTRAEALVFGDDVNTDLLHPSYFYSLDGEVVRSGFLRAVPGRESGPEEAATPRILVAGRNFGCGSSRETTIQALKMGGVDAVVAASFGRIFYRNALSSGLPALCCERAAEKTESGDLLTLDLDQLVVRNETRSTETALEPPDPFWRQVLAAGGLIPFLRERGELEG